jgi:hypothetical protein
MTPRHAHHARLATLATVAATFGLLLVAAPSGAAGSGYGLSFSFSSPEGFEGPIGLAVDNSPDASNGDVYVVDQGHNALKKFSISGNTATQEWKVVIPDATLNQTAAVDDYAGPDEGDVYISGEETHVVYQVNAAGTKIVEVLKSARGVIRGVAVDAAGDFFVLSDGSEEGEVLEYNSKWEPIDAAGLPVPAGENTVVKGLGEQQTDSVGPETFAVSPSGEEIYIAVGAEDKQAYNSVGSRTILATLVAGSYISTTFDPNSSEGVTIAPSGDVFVDQGFAEGPTHNNPGAEVAWYEPSGTLLRTFGAGVLSNRTVYGVGVAGDGDVFVADFGANRVDVFVEGPTSEVPVSEPASGVTSSSAVLHGEVNPHSETEVGWYFAYSTGATCAGGSATPAEGPAVVNARKVESAVAGLEPNRRYTFCLVATDHFGAELGSPLTFTTAAIPPSIEGESAAAVKATEATLKGIVNPNNDPTECYFQYGRANVTENQVGCSQGVLTGLGGQGVSTTVAGLEPGTYKYRVLARNRNGEEAAGPEKEFKRLLAPPEKPTTEEALEITNTVAVLHGVVNPASPSSVGWFFEYAPGASCTGAGASTTPAQGPGEVQAHPTVVKITGLQARTKYTFCLVAENEGKERTAGNEVSLTTTAVPPAIADESAFAVTGSSATLAAQINPVGYETSYYFQYGPSASYGSTAPAPPGVALGAGEGTLPASAHLQGLAAGATYHYRAVAISEVGGETLTIEGPDETFTTQAAGTELTLPDGRAWEMVTPPDKGGALIYGVGATEGDVIQAAADGGGITYGASAPFGSHQVGTRSPEMAQMISTRRAPSSWETEDITTPHNEGASEFRIGNRAEYQLFTSDLSLGFVQPAGDTPLPPLPPGSETTVYLRAANGEYTPLVTSGDVPPGTQFGPPAGTEGESLHFEGASPDLSHVVLFENAGVKLTENAPKGQMLYEWEAGKPEGTLKLVSVVGHSEPPAQEGHLGWGGEDVRNAVSENGSRVIWEADVKGSPGILYMRDMVQEESLRLGGPNAYYETASRDDSRVFFREGGVHGVLKVFELTSGPGEPLAGSVTQLSGGVEGVIGASEDGSYVYFTAGNQLFLDRYEEATKTWGAPRSVASNPSRATLPIGSLAGLAARVSPNGRFLAFMSDASLTGYDNLDANSGAPDEEVYLYDASAGRLVCASCNPTHARPVGRLEEGVTATGEPPLTDPESLWQNEWVAANVPGWTPVNLVKAEYQSRYLSDEGRLFFDSSDALVPADVNGQDDVYEYEPAGVGSCRAPGYGQSASVVFEEDTGGCVGLVSAGTSSVESAFLDASETGGDVFFLTESRLSLRDYDTSYDIYDAHECTASAPCAPPQALAPPPCTTGDACKPAPTPQPALYGAPSSETFSGAGNVVPEPPGPPTKTAKKKITKCSGGKRLSHGRCVKQKRGKRAKKSGRTRGGK